MAQVLHTNHVSSTVKASDLMVSAAQDRSEFHNLTIGRPEGHVWGESGPHAQTLMVISRATRGALPTPCTFPLGALLSPRAPRVVTCK